MLLIYFSLLSITSLVDTFMKDEQKCDGLFQQVLKKKKLKLVGVTEIKRNT